MFGKEGGMRMGSKVTWSRRCRLGWRRSMSRPGRVVRLFWLRIYVG
ncbi:MAG TPA: hypothetical protein VHC01_08850 [Gaiellaceae bacterium]|nr:hypothetical protein [Gaiellaceae bacterium]